MISLTPYKKETNFSKYETLLQAIKEQKSAVKYISSIYPTCNEVLCLRGNLQSNIIQIQTLRKAQSKGRN